MNIFIKTSFLVLGLMLLTACTTFFLFKPGKFTYLYDGKYTGLDTLININGMYYCKISNDKEAYYTAKMFYSDGSICCDQMAYPTISELVSDFVTNKEIKEKKNAIWGNYKIVGDTIKEQIIIYHEFDRNWLHETWYKILDQNTLEMIYSYDPDSKVFYDKFIGRQYCFFSCPTRIDSAHWLKEKKWFWDKGAWKNRKKEK